MKWKFDPKELQATIELQREIFDKALRFVKKGGHIVYATCSVFPAENKEQIDYFLSLYPMLKAKGPDFVSYPSSGGMDGFYSALLQKC